MTPPPDVKIDTSTTNRKKPAKRKSVVVQWFTQILACWYGRTLALFLIVLIPVEMYQFYATRLIPDAFIVGQIKTMVISVNVLVLLNTIVFLIESLGPHAFACKLTKEKGQEFKARYIWFYVLMLATLFGSGAMAFVLWMAAGNELSTRLVYNECWMTFVFLIFLVANNVCIKACIIAVEDENSSLDQQDREEIEELRDDLYKYSRASDAPGLFGMILILVISNMIHFVIHVHDGSVGVAGHEDIARHKELFWQGFIAGSTCLHITYSQAALAFLSVKAAWHTSDP